MIRRILLSLVVAFGLIAIPLPATAQQQILDDIDAQCAQAPESAVCKDRNPGSNPVSGSDGIILQVTRFVAYITGTIAVIIMIIAGIRFITSHGDPQSVTSARNTILYAVIGLIVIVLAQALVAFIINNI